MNVINLRPYQQDLVNNIAKSLHNTPRLLAVMATGGGKTKTFLKIVFKALEKGTTCLIVTESTKIFTQISAEVGNCVNIANGAGELWIKKGGVYVAMAQTLIRRPATLDQFGKLGRGLLVICDEAHVGTTSKVLNKLTDCFLIGFTATPDYRAAKHLPDVYGGIVVGPQPLELIGENALSPYRHYMRVGVDNSKLKVKNGEFTDESQNLAFKDVESVKIMLGDLARTPYRKAVVFCANIETADFVAGIIRASGKLCSVVHSKNPKSDFELFQFTDRDTNIVVSVGSMTKGWDYPAVDLVVLWRATLSLALYLQMIGRGSRVFPGKDSFTVLDYGKNGERFGRWDEDRDWEKMWIKPVDKKKVLGGGKYCPNCLALLPVSSKICGECAFQFPVPKPKESPRETLLRELAEVGEVRVSFLSASSLATYSKIEGKSDFCARVARSKGADFLAQYAEIKGYSNGWIKFQQALPKGFTDITIKI